VKDEIASKHAALAEPLGCVIHAHRRLNISIEDTVAVIGAGPIGSFHGIVSQVQGAQKVFMLDVSPERLTYQKTFGFDDYITVDKEGGHIEKVKELTEGRGADVVIVACGAAQAQADALEIAAKAGRIEYFGGLPKSNPFATLDTNLIHYKEIVVTGSFSETITDFEISHKLVQGGRIPGDKLVTHEVKLENITDAFGLIESGESLKVSVLPK
jgi:L-iditol 2-dehydrogenase